MDDREHYVAVLRHETERIFYDLVRRGASPRMAAETAEMQARKEADFLTGRGVRNPTWFNYTMWPRGKR